MHSLLIIAHKAWESIAELMEPYWFELKFGEYCEGEVSEWDKGSFLAYYGQKDGKEYQETDFDSLYAEKGESWNGNRWRKGDDGVWREYSTRNPDGKWDWYERGGRWAGWLELKEGAEPLAPLNFSYGWSEDLRRRTEDSVPRRADTAYLKDIANIGTLSAGDVMVGGEWKALSDYEFMSVAEFLEGLPDDTVITCVDYHM